MTSSLGRLGLHKQVLSRDMDSIQEHELVALARELV